MPHIADTWLAVWGSTEDLDGAGTDSDLFFSRATDAGETWGASAVLNSDAAADAGIVFTPAVAGSAAGTWVAVWSSDEDLTKPGTTGDDDIHFARSTDNGATWSAVTALHDNAAGDSGEDDFPAIATDDAGTWVVVWESAEDVGGAGTDSDILFVRSTDDATTWSAPAPLHANATSDTGTDARPALAADAAGDWVAIWESREDLDGAGSSDFDIFVIRSSDGGATWSSVGVLNDNADTDSARDDLVDLATDGGGHWVAAWRGSENLGGMVGTDIDIFYSRSTDGGVTWSSVDVLNENATSDSSPDGSVDLAGDGSGTWVAVWTSSEDMNGAGADNDVFVSRSTDDGAAWSSVALLNSNAMTDAGADFTPSIAGDGTGNWVVLWSSDANLASATGDHDILIARSTDDGLSWSAAARLDTAFASDTGQDSGVSLFAR